MSDNQEQKVEKDDIQEDIIVEDENVSTESVDETVEEPTVVEEGHSENSQDLQTLQNEYDELEDKLLRVQAEFQNSQRRLKRDKEQIQKYRSQSLAKNILFALDNLNRALSVEVDTEAGENLKKGIKLVLDSLEESLSQEGIEEIDAIGKTFDPNFHEAYNQIPAPEGIESGQVAEVFEKGYKIHDRVLRPAKVAVAQ